MRRETERILEKIKRALPAYEDAHRVEHTLGVLEECRFFASFMGLSETETRSILIAALLHDIAKNVPEQEARARLAAQGIETERIAAPILHQYLGAPMAREIFGGAVVDEAVVSAIACHTTGKPGMSVLDQILFIADYEEAGRSYYTCTELREYLHMECGKLSGADGAKKRALLREGTKRIVRMTLTHLIERGEEVDIGTVQTWNDLLSCEKRKEKI